MNADTALTSGDGSGPCAGLEKRSGGRTPVVRIATFLARLILMGSVLVLFIMGGGTKSSGRTAEALQPWWAKVTGGEEKPFSNLTGAGALLRTAAAKLEPAGSEPGVQAAGVSSAAVRRVPVSTDEDLQENSFLWTNVAIPVLPATSETNPAAEAAYDKLSIPEPENTGEEGPGIKPASQNEGRDRESTVVAWPRIDPADITQPVRSIPSATGLVAVTFDDGPYRYWTEEYVRILVKKKAGATFFLVAQRALALPKDAKLIADAGMEIGSHSYRHRDLLHLKPAEVEDDLAQAVRILDRFYNRPVQVFRPPYGKFNPGIQAVSSELGQVMVTWSIDPRDWEPVESPKVLAQKVLQLSSDGSIILLHEGRELTAQALPLIIDGLRAKGLEPVSVSTLLMVLKSGVTPGRW